VNPLLIPCHGLDRSLGRRDVCLEGGVGAQDVRGPRGPSVGARRHHHLPGAPQADTWPAEQLRGDELVGDPPGGHVRGEATDGHRGTGLARSHDKRPLCIDPEAPGIAPRGFGVVGQGVDLDLEVVAGLERHTADGGRRSPDWFPLDPRLPRGLSLLQHMGQLVGEQSLPLGAAEGGGARVQDDMLAKGERPRVERRRRPRRLAAGVHSDLGEVMSEPSPEGASLVRGQRLASTAHLEEPIQDHCRSVRCSGMGDPGAAGGRHRAQPVAAGRGRLGAAPPPVGMARVVLERVVRPPDPQGSLLRRPRSHGPPEFAVVPGASAPYDPTSTERALWPSHLHQGRVSVRTRRRTLGR
jgi:hypothetical protein